MCKFHNKNINAVSCYKVVFYVFYLVNLCLSTAQNYYPSQNYHPYVQYYQPNMYYQHNPISYHAPNTEYYYYYSSDESPDKTVQESTTISSYTVKESALNKDCSSFLDKINKNIYRPVCGSDGITYVNKEDLMFQSCLGEQIGHQPVTVLNVGECLNHRSTDYKDDDKPQIAKFNCNQLLDNTKNTNQEPVCGSDGKTYINKQYMLFQSCIGEDRGQQKVTVLHIGECSNSGKDKFNCHALLTKYPDRQPVCGTDGKTYASKGNLMFQTCLEQQKGQKPVGVAYTGQCFKDGDNDPQSLQCFKLLDETRHSKAEPVCGSDGRTYSNKQYLAFHSCLGQHKGEREITILHTGECLNSVAKDPVGILECNTLLQTTTTSPYNPVCGTDKKTYANKEYLMLHNCLGQKRGQEEVALLHQGECTDMIETNNVKTLDCLSILEETKMAVYKPVCGTDKKTYVNKQYLMLHSCLRQQKGEPEVAVQFLGECSPVCPTTFYLPSLPVCGSDGETYNTIEALERRNCLKSLTDNNKIEVAHHGYCPELPVKGIVYV